MLLLLVSLPAGADLIEIVHLKNGSSIRGLIIEQVPGKTLKVETLDAVVLTIEMEDVAKITKEEGLKQAAGWAETESLDVLQLKSGLEIKGMIIEQVFGKTVTLESPYGSIFVIDAIDIARMSKQAVEPRTIWLGAQCTSISAVMAKDMAIVDKKGALVVAIYRGSPADKGGIRPGDFITHVNGRQVRDVFTLERALADTGPGRAGLQLHRSYETVELSVDANVKVSTKNSLTDNPGYLWPGAAPAVLTKDKIRQVGLDDGMTGVLIAQVVPRTPAARADLRKNDVVIRVAFLRVKTVADFYNALNNAEGEQIPLRIKRQGRVLNLTLRR